MFFNLLGNIWKKLPKKIRRWLTRLFQTTFTVSAAGIITNERGEVLLLDHILRPVSGWGLPGGFLESGEQLETAFRREILEETGLGLRDVIFVQTRTLYRHIEIIFAAKAVGEATVKSREIKELGWFDLDNMPSEMSLDQQLLIFKVLRPGENPSEMRG